MILGNNNTITMTYNALTATNKAIEKTARALSTGQKAASASDDAAGVAIGMKISAQVAGVDRAIRNTQDGISLLQTAEGGLNQINSMLQRMRDLAVQAANDTLTIQDRGYIQNEIAQLRESINNVANNTTFNSKRLLDGSSAAEWTSDNASTKLKVSGALTEIDQFGQKKQIEGNYRIEIHAKAGQGQVQKSSIFTIPKIQDGDSDLEYQHEININDGVDANGETFGSGWYFEDGVLNITARGKYSIVGNKTETSNRIVIKQGIEAQVRLTDVNIKAQSGSAFDIAGSDVKLFLKGENILSASDTDGQCAGLQVQNINGGPSGSVVINSTKGTGSTEGKLTAKGNLCGAGIGGPCHHDEEAWQGSVGAITINGGTIVAVSGDMPGAGIGGGGYYSDYPGDESHVNITINGGDITATAQSDGAGIGSGGYGQPDASNVDSITINGGKITAQSLGKGAAIGGGSYSNSGLISISREAELNLTGWIDTGNGASQSIGRGVDGAATNGIYNNVTFTNPAPNSITIEDIPEFYNASGVFLVNEPQKITITQGDGKSTDVMLYRTDTIEDVRSKLNNAIAFGLGQSAYTDNNDNFVTFVNPGANDSQGFESVEGTFVIRSAVAGSAGNLTFGSDNQDLINAFGLNTIQEASENTFTASVYDAHTGRAIANNVSTQGNMLNGVISPNASIEFDAMANIKASWDEGSKRYILSSETQAYTTTLHIKDKSTSFQIGQNLGEDIYLNIGDVRAEALHIDKVDVTTRENAAKSITLLDAALHEVNVQRSRIGAYQNELEYNANSLTQTSLHMQESESRIKDADMAKEYMEFVKLQILNNTGNSMLSQSQQNAQSIMNVLTQ